MLSSTVLLCGGAAGEESAVALVRAINAYRSEPQVCEGRNTAPVAPLAADATLAAALVAAGAPLQQALKARGYQAAQARAIHMTGPGSADRAMELLRQRYCQTLLDAASTQIGVAREGDTWRIVLARPLLSADLRDWREAGQAILRLTNAARAEPRNCGNKRFLAAPPLRWAHKLAAASLAHSQDMARRNYFEHRAPDGGDAGERVGRTGYDWRQVGENIAAGQGSVQEAVAGWLSSPTHCTNIMTPGFREMGAAYAVDPRSDKTI